MRVAAPPRRGGAAHRARTPNSTKLTPPGLPIRHLERSRLRRLLTEGAERPLTLISAHAGTGKTVLLSAWSRDREDVAWLTLDRADNWSPRFWRGVEDALQVRGRRLDDDPVSRVLRWAGSRDEPVILVLDDLHEIESPIVLRELDALIARAPEQLRLIISTRSDPQLRLQRHRLSAQLMELRASDLAFVLAECAELLPDLRDDDVRTLHEHTEGWPAAVRLAAISLEKHSDPTQFIRRFAGDDRAVADYLLTEILDRQSPERRDFLFCSAVPETVDATLVNELTGRSDGGAVLDALANENFLVSAHVGSTQVYRYPALLREFLRAQLAARDTSRYRAVELRTGRWYWRHLRPLPAFRHGLAARDWELVDELSAEAWHLAIFGVPGAPDRRIEEASESDLRSRPALALAVAMSLLYRGDRRGARRRLERAAIESASDPERREVLEVLYRRVVLAIARLDGDFGRARSVAAELLDLPPGGTYSAEKRRWAQRAIALSHVGAAELGLGRFEEAELHLTDGLELSQELGLDEPHLDCLSQSALLNLARGRIRRGAELATEGIGFAERRGWSNLFVAVGCHLALGWASYVWDDLTTASDHLERAKSAAASSGDRIGNLGASVLTSLVLAAQGPAGAELGLRKLRRFSGDFASLTVPSYLEPVVAAAEARILVACGALDQARERAAGSSPSARLVRAHLALAASSPEQALHELDGLASGTVEADLSSRVEASVLEAVAHHACTDRLKANQAISDALALTGPNNHRRPFVDAGPRVRELLVDQVRHGTSHRSLVSDLIAALDRRAPLIDVTPRVLLEPLSEREAAVLRYLPTMMSNAEIGSELFLSVNTVKTHLKSIYRKLDAASRRDAIERARRLDLL